MCLRSFPYRKGRNTLFRPSRRLIVLFLLYILGYLIHVPFSLNCQRQAQARPTLDKHHTTTSVTLPHPISTAPSNAKSLPQTVKANHTTYILRTFFDPLVGIRFPTDFQRSYFQSHTVSYYLQHGTPPS